MIDGKNFSDQPVRSNVKTHDNIQKVATDDHTNWLFGAL